MNRLTQRQMHQHIQILGWLHIVVNLFTLLIAALLFVFLTSIGPLVGDVEATRILGVVAPVLSIFLAGLALPGILAGIGLLARRNWGRFLAIIVGIFNLVVVPVGTAVGFYTLWVLFRNEAADYFSVGAQKTRPPLQSLTPTGG